MPSGFRCFSYPATGCSGRLRYLGGAMLEDLVDARVHGFRSYYYCRDCEAAYCLQWVEADGSLSIWTMDEADIREGIRSQAIHWRKGAIRVLEDLLER